MIFQEISNPVKNTWIIIKLRDLFDKKKRTILSKEKI